MRKENIIRDNNGKFQPVYKIWSLKNFNDGYVNFHGRFMVRLPNHHRANKNGWVIRAIAAYEAYHHRERVTTDYVIHHKDENKLNDSKENLIKMKFGEHTRLHWKGKSRQGQNKHLRTGKERNCPICHVKFYRAAWGLLKTNYCSKKCWYARNKITVHCNTCGKEFVKFKHRVRKVNFCTRVCMHTFNALKWQSHLQA